MRGLRKSLSPSSLGLLAEAGEGEDGRMKSAIGIGALLMDGIGDTIRVSLTEDPEYEIDPCRRLASLGTRAAHEVGTAACPADTPAEKDCCPEKKRLFAW